MRSESGDRLRVKREPQTGLVTANDYLLTIVTINRNNAENLHKTLISLGQLRDNPAVECIFVDGASTDESVALARDFYRSDLLVSEPDAGVYHAMNKGLYRAHGKYVLWLNSGDELLPNVFEQVQGRLLASDAAVLAFGIERIAPVTLAVDYRIPSIADLPLATFPHQGLFFNRRKIIGYGGYNEGFAICGDHDLLIRLFLAQEDIVVYDTVVSRWYADGVSAGSGTEIERMYLLGKFGLVRRFRVFYWWLVGDFRRFGQLWCYVGLRWKMALRRIRVR